jgi:hypothetical protein
MFNYKKYRQGHYDKYAIKKNNPFRNSYDNSIGAVKSVVVNGQPHPNSRIMVLLHRRSQFNKSKRKRLKKRKTVRFSETLEEKYIIQDHHVNNKVEDDQKEKIYDCDISFDFEELI